MHEKTKKEKRKQNKVIDKNQINQGRRMKSEGIHEKKEEGVSAHRPDGKEGRFMR